MDISLDHNLSNSFDRLPLFNGSVDGVYR